MTKMNPEDRLCDELDAFCDEHGLEPRSADEMALDESLTHEQRVWLADFVTRWEREVEGK